MLESSLFESRGRPKTRKPSTVILSVALHAGIVVALILLPLLRPEALPILASVPGIPLPPSPKEVIDITPVPKRAPDIQRTIQPQPGKLIVPRKIPAFIATDIGGAACGARLKSFMLPRSIYGQAL